MVYADIVLLLAVLEFLIFAVLVGKARGTYNVAAPATTGNEIFERYYRVQMNTLENLVMFIPAMFLSATYWNGLYSAILGVIFIIGRIVYFRAYVKGAQIAHPGLCLSVAPLVILILAD